MRIGKYLILPNRVRFTYGINIINMDCNVVNTYCIQITTKRPYWYPHIGRNTLKIDDGVKRKSMIYGWLFIYFVKMSYNGNI